MNMRRKNTLTYLIVFVMMIDTNKRNRIQPISNFFIFFVLSVQICKLYEVGAEDMVKNRTHLHTHTYDKISMCLPACLPADRQASRQLGRQVFTKLVFHKKKKKCKRRPFST